MKVQRHVKIRINIDNEGLKKPDGGEGTAKDKDISGDADNGKCKDKGEGNE